MIVALELITSTSLWLWTATGSFWEKKWCNQINKRLPMKYAFRDNYWHRYNSTQNVLIMSHDPLCSDWDLVYVGKPTGRILHLYLRAHLHVNRGSYLIFVPQDEARITVYWDMMILGLLHCPPTWASDIVLLQNLVVSAGTHSASWDGEAEGTTAPIIHTACVVTWRNRFQIRCLAHLKLHFRKCIGILLFCLLPHYSGFGVRHF